MKGLCSQSNLTELEPGWALHRPSDKPDIYLHLKVENGTQEATSFVAPYVL